MTAKTTRPVALALAMAAACTLPPAAGHAETPFITTDRPLPRNLDQAPKRKGLLSRVRVAMGLGPEPGEPMQLVPPQPQGVFDPPAASDPGPSDWQQDERRDVAEPLGDPTVPAVLRRPPPRPLVSVVTEPFGSELPDEPDDEPASSPLAVTPPPPPPSPARLLAGSSTPAAAVPRRNPVRKSVSAATSATAANRPSDRDEAEADGEIAVSAVAMVVAPEVSLSTDSAADTDGADTDGAAETNNAAAMDGTNGTDAGTASAKPADVAPPSPPAKTRAAESPAPDTKAPAAAGTATAQPRKSPPQQGRSDGLPAFAATSVREVGAAAPQTPPDHREADEENAAPEDGEAQMAPTASELRKLMRMMSALQDDIARGASAALRAQRVLSARVAEEIGKIPPETLAATTNARALLHYALTGGSPAEVRTAVDRTDFPPPYDELIAGALAFLEGRPNDARRHFDAADLDHLPAVTEGPVHLALAALAVEKEPEKALEHLDWARHSAPATLIEEAALRRAVLITAERNDQERFETLTNRYLRKFRASAYAGNFRRRLASALTRMQFLDEPGGMEKLDAVLAPMTPGGRREIYLDLARAAVETGRSAVAASAARRSREIAPSNSLDATRADLYAAAADVVDPGRNEAAVAALDTIDEAPLSEGDRVLRAAALRLGQAVADIPEPAPPEPPPALTGAELPNIPVAYATDLMATAAAAEEEPAPSAIEQRVRTTLDEIDAILRSSP